MTRELILYATPVGQLADACREYFAFVEPTTAQDYPPHITLTGFFCRSDPSIAIDAARRVIADAGPVPADAVHVTRLACSDGWVGLEITSPWLEQLTRAFADLVPAGPDEDTIRCKDWLHLSLAYGRPDLAVHAAEATRRIDPAAPVQWDVALWERDDRGVWARH